MFSRIQSKLGTAGLIVAIVALVAALAGGAYAASGLNGKQKKQVRNIAKSESKKWSKKFSKRFATTGPQGAAGPIGPAGPAGPAGTAGAKGADGSDGSPGKSVEVSGTALGCGAGGITVEVEGSGEENEVCNGEDGEDGESGFTATLPPEETETGVWTLGQSTKSTEALAVFQPISFPIPLAEPLQEQTMHYITPGGKEIILNESTFEPEEIDPTDCLGEVAEPTAEPGHLCVYAGVLENAEAQQSSFINPLNGDQGLNGAGIESATTGAVMAFETTANQLPKGLGTWAVTACPEGGC